MFRPVPLQTITSSYGLQAQSLYLLSFTIKLTGVYNFWLLLCSRSVLLWQPKI